MVFDQVWDEELRHMMKFYIDKGLVQTIEALNKGWMSSVFDRWEISFQQWVFIKATLCPIAV